VRTVSTSNVRYGSARLLGLLAAGQAAVVHPGCCLHCRIGRNVRVRNTPPFRRLSAARWPRPRVATLASRYSVIDGNSHPTDEAKRVAWLTVDEAKRALPKSGHPGHPRT
jgi:hypothetical protein